MKMVGFEGDWNFSAPKLSENKMVHSLEGMDLRKMIFGLINEGDTEKLREKISSDLDLNCRMAWMASQVLTPMEFIAHIKSEKWLEMTDILLSKGAQPRWGEFCRGASEASIVKWLKRAEKDELITFGFDGLCPLIELFIRKDVRVFDLALKKIGEIDEGMASDMMERAPCNVENLKLIEKFISEKAAQKGLEGCLRTRNHDDEKVDAVEFYRLKGARLTGGGSPLCKWLPNGKGKQNGKKALWDMLIAEMKEENPDEWDRERTGSALLTAALAKADPWWLKKALTIAQLDEFAWDILEKAGRDRESLSRRDKCGGLLLSVGCEPQLIAGKWPNNEDLVKMKVSLESSELSKVAKQPERAGRSRRI